MYGVTNKEQSGRIRLFETKQDAVDWAKSFDIECDVVKMPGKLEVVEHITPAPHKCSECGRELPKKS